MLRKREKSKIACMYLNKTSFDLVEDKQFILNLSWGKHTLNLDVFREKADKHKKWMEKLQQKTLIDSYAECYPGSVAIIKSICPPVDTRYLTYPYSLQNSERTLHYKFRDIVLRNVSYNIFVVLISHKMQIVKFQVWNICLDDLHACRFCIVVMVSLVL